MKILFIVQGEGRGHMTQAISLQKKLLREGHQLVGVLVGKSPSRNIPDFFTKAIKAPIYTFDSPNFMPTAKNKKSNIIMSILLNILQIHKYIHSIRYLNQIIKDSEADTVINFYEIITGLTYLCFRPKATMICIAHQYLFLHPDFKFPPEKRLFAIMSLKIFTRITAFGASKKLALSFREMQDDFDRRISVVPPLLRDEVVAKTPIKGEYIHGYVVNSGFSEDIMDWHTTHPEVPLHFFWDKKNTTPETVVSRNLVFHQLDDQKFIDYMVGSKAYATTAGFESVCEAMYLGKPILMVPAHIEQMCNAYDASISGAGVIANSFDMDVLLNFMKNYTPDPDFRAWVKSADRLILKEFDEEPLVGAFERSHPQLFPSLT